MFKCDRCGEIAHHSLYNRKYHLCSACSKQWHYECQVNGVTSGKRNYNISQDNVKYWEYQFNKFLKGTKPFVFR
jgi:hypothetical protein